MTSQGRSDRIATNTVFLVVRMLLWMGVMLYSSRLIFKALGPVDYGIYNIVGGIALTFVFLSSSLATATQRYLAYEIGQRNIEGLKRIYGVSLIIHIALALAVIVIGECVGLYLMYHKLNIPAERFDAALWVFHSTILSLSVMLLGSIYDSVLIARENMRVYAYAGILDALLKLVLVMLLSVAPYDKLIFYAVGSLVLVIVVKCVPAIICFRSYPECRGAIRWDRERFTQMYHFIGWNGVEAGTYAVWNYGLDYLLNIFFGTIVNAARGIAAQINSAVGNFSVQFFTALRSQLVQSYTTGDIDYYKRLIYGSSRYSYFLTWALSLPLMLRMDYVLELWLGSEVPSEAADYARWILAFCLINVLGIPLWNGVQATGNVRRCVLIGTTISLMVLPIVYFGFELGLASVFALQAATLVRLVYVWGNFYALRREVLLSVREYLRRVWVPILGITSVSALMMYYVDQIFDQTFLALCAVSAISFLLIGLLVWFLGLNEYERTFILKRIRKLIGR